MQIAGEEKIDVAACESGHGHVGAADQATEAFRRWSVERVMSDDNARDVAGIGLQPRAGCRRRCPTTRLPDALDCAGSRTA